MALLILVTSASTDSPLASVMSAVITPLCVMMNWSPVTPSVGLPVVVRLVEPRLTFTGVVPTAPPENETSSATAGAVVGTVYEAVLNDLSWRAWRSVDCIDSIVLVIAEMPLSAASSVLMPTDIESSKALRSPARLCSEAEVKKLVGLSSAELTFLPVARRFWVVLIRSAVFCRDSRFCRTPAERTMSLMTRVPL